MKLIKGEFKEKLDLLLAPSIRAGFPSPAEDYLSDSIDSPCFFVSLIAIIE